MSEVEKLPQGWVNATLDEITEWGSGGTPKRSISKYYEGGHIPWVTITDLNNGIVNETATYITEVGVDESSAKLVPKDTILLALYGSIGKLGIAGLDLTTNQAIATAKPNPNWYENKYLFYYLESQASNLNNLGSGVTQKNIYLKDVKNYQIPLAPRDEQRRIIFKLEELISEFENGVSELKLALDKLTQYRQSLLKSAVEGSLTQQWRAENSDQVQETGEQLLARILKQRREQWQQQKLAEFAEKGKTPPKNWQDKYPEPVQPDTTNLPELPEGWVWASVAQLGYVQLGRQRTPSKMKGENPQKYIRAANITEQGINFNDVLEMDFTEKEIPIYQLKTGDLLLTEASGSPEHVGRPCIWPDVDGVYCFQNTVIRFQPSVISADFSFFIFYAYQKLGKYIDVSGGVGINHLSAGKFSKIAVPLPPLVEQGVLVAEITAELDAIDRQTEATVLGLKQSEAQRKNILKSAFSGQLVPQDPNDEPASVLLEKIKQEREALAKKPKTKHIKTKSAMKKITVEELTKWVSDYEGNSFTFGELQKTFQGDYDQLRDCVFEILSAKESILKQVFDQKLNAITFIKEDK
ncbi:restriction endonuclease subunit S [Vibrio fluvialis]|uniref:restriction endonuclease subunit S n=1 Tax=Vibrio fluvialis TaxID=676 RepID=UPI00192AE100|nr:restriction endonuclease subunit S [Vibrio fluvialis]